MPDIKKDSNSDLRSQLTAFKETKLASLKEQLSAQKSRADSLQSAIKAKRAAFIEAEEQKRLEEQQKAELEALKLKEAEEAKKSKKKVEAEEQKPAEELKPEKDEQPVEQKPADKKSKEAKPEKVEPKLIPTDKENIFIEIAPDGTERKVYKELPKPPKTAKPDASTGKGESTVKTRNFGPNGYQTQRGPKPQGNTNAPRPAGGRPSSPISPAPQPFPPKPNTPKKGGKKDTSNGKEFDGSKKMNKRDLMRKGYMDYENVTYDENGEEFVRSYKVPKNRGGGNSATVVIENAVITTDPVAIKTLSEKIGKSAGEIVKTLFILGIMKTINDSIDFETAELVASEFGIRLEYKPDVTLEETLTAQLDIDEVEDLDNLVPRPPVVTIMGHVDHGKTSLLDYIRKTKVTAGEAGGITQHIGAYTVSLDGKKITFLDTPGHEAFTSMRARGAQVTDIAVLVVAADDGVMPQTIEAINHAKQAGVSIVVAVNKIDKPGANPDKVIGQLPEYGIVPEEWDPQNGVPIVQVSAKTGQNVDTLLETILTVAEIKELVANPNRNARGTIIEARLDKGLGKVATILVQTGTLKIGDFVVAGTSTGRIRAMIDDKGKKVKKAGPSTAVSVTGWDDVPEAGDRIDVVADEKFARALAEERRLKLEASKVHSTAVSLNDLFDKISKGELKSVKLIVKADVQGSVEAVNQSLAKLGNEEVGIDIIHSAVGAVKESDINLAETAGAIIVVFNLAVDSRMQALADQKHISLIKKKVIYDVIDEIEKAVKGQLAPKYREVSLGSAEIRELFKISGVGTIAGSHVVDGKIVRGAKARLVRDGKIVYTGEIASLRHGKDDVKEMQRNFDCGIMLQNFQDVKVGDIIEAFEMEQITDED